MTEAIKFSIRLRQAIEEAGYEIRPIIVEREFNQRYWGRSVSFQAVRRWLNGDAMPTQDKLEVLAEWLQVDSHWLRFGEKLNGSIQDQRKRWDAKMTHEERKVIESFMNLSAEKRKIVGIIIQALSKP